MLSIRPTSIAIQLTSPHEAKEEKKDAIVEKTEKTTSSPTNAIPPVNPQYPIQPKLHNSSGEFVTQRPNAYVGGGFKIQRSDLGTKDYDRFLRDEE